MWKRRLLPEAAGGGGHRACWRGSRRSSQACEVLASAWSSRSLPRSTGDRHTPEVSGKMTRGVFAGQQGLGFSFQGHINRKSISSHRRSCPRRVSHLGPSTRPLGGPCGSWSPGPRPAGPVRTASGWAVRLWGEISHRHCVAL